MTWQRKTKSLNGPLNVKKHLTSWNDNLLKNQYCWCLTSQNHCKLSLMHQKWRQEQYLLNWIQMVTNTLWHMSKMFTDTEKKYKIYNRELLGIIWALKEWRHYIQESEHTTVVFSNHKNLTYFRTAQKLNNRQVRWLPNLSKFTIKLIHLPGSKMIQSDALSWWPDHGIEGQLEEEEMIMLPENMFINLLDTDLQKRILNGKNWI